MALQLYDLVSGEKRATRFRIRPRHGGPVDRRGSCLLVSPSCTQSRVILQADIKYSYCASGASWGSVRRSSIAETNGSAKSLLSNGGSAQPLLFWHV